MSDSTVTPEADAAVAPPVAGSPAAGSPEAPASPSTQSELGKALEAQELSIRSLLEAGAHYGHQPGRWNPLMRSYLFGERNGTHIIDLDQTLPLLKTALDFLRETTAQGGKVLFVGTKRQAAPSVMAEATRAGQHYVNNRWLGGMLTNWKTVKKSIDRYNSYLEILASEDKRAELSKKELAGMTRQVEKYAKSLAGIRTMERQPDALFIIDVGKEAIAVHEAKRLHIPIVGIVDSNCSPRDIDFVVPGNDDAIRAIDLYSVVVADACREGYELHQAELVSQRANQPTPRKGDSGPKTGRRVVEIKQAPRRSRSASSSAGGGKAYTAGGSQDADARGTDSTPAPTKKTKDPAPATDKAPAAPAAPPETPASPESRE
jgi:small subunit ribosomal protein S2